MRFGSVCSGIEAASVAWEPLGWKAAWFAEIEPFPSAVLAHHYPDTPNLGDMSKIAARIEAGEVEAPDMLCGGTPCQAFSVAGLRQSLADERGNLSLTFCQLADTIDAARPLLRSRRMTVCCIGCSRFNLRDADKALARMGFGCCEIKRKGELVSSTWPRDCRHHDPAPAAVVEKRRQWLENRARATNRTTE